MNFLIAYAALLALSLMFVLHGRDKLQLALRVPLVAVVSFLAPGRLIEAIGPRMRENGHVTGDDTVAIAFMTILLFVGTLAGPAWVRRVLYQGIKEPDRPKQVSSLKDDGAPEQRE